MIGWYVEFLQLWDTEILYGNVILWKQSWWFIKSCLTLFDPMDCNLPSSSVYGISQARILEWNATSFSRGSSPPRNWNQVSWIAGRFFTDCATREARKASYKTVKKKKKKELNTPLTLY